LGEEHKLRGLKTVLGKIFGSKREEDSTEKIA
jgi:hypothetical protein